MCVQSVVLGSRGFEKSLQRGVYTGMEMARISIHKLYFGGTVDLAVLWRQLSRVTAQGSKP